MHTVFDIIQDADYQSISRPLCCSTPLGKALYRFLTVLMSFNLRRRLSHMNRCILTKDVLLTPPYSAYNFMILLCRRIAW